VKVLLTAATRHPRRGANEPGLVTPGARPSPRIRPLEHPLGKRRHSHVEKHGSDGCRVCLDGGSVSLDLGLGAGITRYIDDGARV
jgi:hypothetical protein